MSCLILPAGWGGHGGARPDEHQHRRKLTSQYCGVTKLATGAAMQTVI